MEWPVSSHMDLRQHNVMLRFKKAVNQKTDIKESLEAKLALSTPSEVVRGLNHPVQLKSAAYM